MRKPRQLALDLTLPESYCEDDYIVGKANVDAHFMVTSPWGSPFMALCGENGAGKSHLANIWAERVGARRLAAKELDMQTVKTSLLTGALLLEDASEKTSATPLFHLLNFVKEEGAQLLITAQNAPASWNISPPDLQSRLRLIPLVTLLSPDDDMLKAIYVKLFADKQLNVDFGVVESLISRSERSIIAAKRMVDKLDRRALEEGRRVTKPLALQILEEAA